MRQMPTAQHIEQALREFGLDCVPDRNAGEFSLGERRALCLAAAQIRLRLGSLKVLLLDEPQNGLDVERQRALTRLIADATKNGCCVLIAEHSEAHLSIKRDVSIELQAI
jgi:ABC-type Mn2+/Zn2+ transport system ATPase subunit